MSFPTNRPSLDDLRRLSAPEIAELPPEVLAALQHEADLAVGAARDVAERLGGCIALRYADRAAAARQADGKDTGTVRLEDGEVTVIADLPKKVEWDQAALSDMIARIRAAGDDPAEYVETTLRVSERKYAAWPASIREGFEAARTVKPGKPTFRLVVGEAR